MWSGYDRLISLYPYIFPETAKLNKCYIFRTVYFNLDCFDWRTWKSLWIARIWTLRLFASPKVFSQIWHLWGFSFSWTFITWVFIVMCWENFIVQSGHSNGFTFSWTCLMCLWRVRLKLKFFWHFPHWKVRSFSWTDSICRWRSRRVDELESISSTFYEHRFFL